MLAERVFLFVFLSLAVAAMSLTITKGKIFKPFRSWVESRHPWWGSLFSCAYCMTHWIAFVFVALIGPIALTGYLALDFVVMAFAVVGLSALITGGIANLLGIPEAQVEEIKRQVAEFTENVKASAEEQVEAEKKRLGLIAEGKVPPAGDADDDESDDESPPWVHHHAGVIDGSGADHFSQLFDQSRRPSGRKGGKVS